MSSPHRPTSALVAALGATAVAGVTGVVSAPAAAADVVHVVREGETLGHIALRHGTTVGAGFAVCSNKESGKKFYQEFAIMSMAQTRAIGKAYRNCLAWIIRAAGYEPTPAEEMDYNTNTVAVANPAPAAQPVPAMQVVPAEAPAATAEAPAAAPVQYATDAQKEEIIRLLNHPVITRQEKTKMLLNINRLDEERATQAIAKLRKAIEDREGTSAVAA